MEPTRKINKLSLNQETVRKLIDEPFSTEPNRLLSHVTICTGPFCTP